MIELQIASFVGFVLCTFFLYRLLVRNYERQVAILKDELLYKHNYKAQLEELKLFYQEQREMVNTRIASKEEENIELEMQLTDIGNNLDEITRELKSESVKSQRVTSISSRKNRFLENKLLTIENDFMHCNRELKESKQQYTSLVDFIKSKYGADALIEFHYGDNASEQVKHRRRHSLKAKYGSTAR